MRISLAKITAYLVSGVAVLALVGAMGGTWSTSQPAVAAPVTTPTASPDPPATGSAPRATPPAAGSATTPVQAAGSSSSSPPPSPPSSPATAAPTKGRAVAGKRELAGKLNLNTATADQLLMLPTVGPAKAERIIVWRQKNGGFKRVADLRRVKGFGYKTFKRLEPFLAITGDSTLAIR